MLPFPGVEEGSDAYHRSGFHPAYIGNIYDRRYKALYSMAREGRPSPVSPSSGLGLYKGYRKSY